MTASNMKLLLAGMITLFAGVLSTSPHGWVVAVVGGIMVGAAVYRDQVALAALRVRSESPRPVGGPWGAHERITRERVRETRERR